MYWPGLVRRCRCQQEAVVCSFVKWGIAIPKDWSRNSEINIGSLCNYKVGELHDFEAADFYSLSSDESSDHDSGEDEESCEFSSDYQTLHSNIVVNNHILLTMS